MKTSLTIQIRTACFVVGFILVLPGTTLFAQDQQGKEYINKKEGLRLQLPPGWRESKVSRKTGIVVGFESAGKGLVFLIQHLSVPQLNPEAAKIGLDQEFAKDTSMRKLSEEEAWVAGIPARKMIFDKRTATESSRLWVIMFFGQGELWQIILGAENPSAMEPGEVGYQRFQQILSSFQFLEPVLSRIKNAPTPFGTAANSAVPKVENGQRFYINDRLGMKVLLPPDWELLDERPGPVNLPMTVILGPPTTLARLILTREIAEATPEIYRNLVKQLLDRQEDYQDLGEDTVTQGGLEGTKLAIATKENGIAYRSLMRIFSKDNEHFRIHAVVPAEYFNRYEAVLRQMLDSVEFPGLSKDVSPTPRSTFVGTTGRVTGSEIEELARLKEKVAQTPNDYRVHVDLGSALDDAGETGAAITEYKSAIRLNPNSPQAHRNLGVSYLRQNNLKAAEDELRQAVRLNPTYFLAHLSLAQALIRRDDLKSAAEEYRATINIDREQIRNLMLGTIDFQKAPELAQDFASAPAEAVAHFYVALTLWSAKLDCHKTVSELEDAVRIWPNFAFAKASMDQQRNECRSSQEADRGQQSATEHTKP